MAEPNFEDQPATNQQKLELNFENGISTPNPDWRKSKESSTINKPKEVLNIQRDSKPQPAYKQKLSYKTNPYAAHSFEPDDAFTETGYNNRVNSKFRTVYVGEKEILQKFDTSKAIWVTVEEA
jgi:hypothetical protein